MQPYAFEASDGSGILVRTERILPDLTTARDHALAMATEQARRCEEAPWDGGAVVVSVRVRDRAVLRVRLAFDVERFEPG